jgi:protein O-mannosyl-transferase
LDRSLSILAAVLILVGAVAVSFSPCLKAGFLNWDDDINILENTSVRSMDPANLKRIFSESVQKIYIPLTTLSYAVEYQAVGHQPFLYHLNNVILHIFNTLLVFVIAWRFGLTAGGALLAALLFGVHPMKVESVAWVTERKDVLYAFFYLLSVFFYMRYLQCRGTARCAPTQIYIAAVAAGFLSVLAKPMALSLPLILALIDWLQRRPWSRRSWTDKIPFVLTIAPVVWITYAQHVRNPVTDAGQAVLIWIWTFVFYLWKFAVPVVLIPLYRLPQPVSLANPHFLIPAMVVVSLIISLIVWRRNRWWLFAVGYYVLSIFFLLRFDVGVDLNVVADRFMYLPCLGFCLAAGVLFSRFTPARRAVIVSAAVIGLLMIKTYAQSQVWQTPMSLWNYVVAKDPQSHIGYNNRGNIFNERDQLNEAMADYQKAIAINPGFARALNNRGIVFAKAGRNAEALEDFNKAIAFKPDFEKAYYNRAMMEERLGRYDRALVDARKALELGAPVPPDTFPRLNRKIKSLP